MVDVFSIITPIVLSAIALATIFMFLIRFSHPDDKNEAQFPRIIVIIGFFLAFSIVLMLPYDALNSRSTSSLISSDSDAIAIVQQVLIYMVIAQIFLLIPFAFFFYEGQRSSDEEIDYKNENKNSRSQFKCRSQLSSALCQTILMAAGFALTLIIMYLFMNETSIPVNRKTQSLRMILPTNVQPSDIQKYFGRDKKTCSFIDANIQSLRSLNPLTQHTDSIINSNTLSKNFQCQSSKFNQKFAVTFPVFTIALIGFIGQFFFIIFVGIGLISLPLDLFNDQNTRPNPISVKEYINQKLLIGNRAKALRKNAEALSEQQLNTAGTKVSRKNKRLYNKTKKEFIQAVYLLKKDYMMIQVSYHLKGGNPIVYQVKLVLSFLCFGMTLAWILHICLFIIPNQPVHPFLNSFFEYLTFDNFSLGGVLAYACYSLYLLWCSIAGNFKFGLRIPYIMKIYPMELRNTMMNAFLVNCQMVLITSLPTAQFCSMAFPIYGRGSNSNVFFDAQIRHMKFFRQFFDYNVFIYVMLVFVFLTLIYLIAFPKDRAKQIEQNIEKYNQIEDNQKIDAAVSGRQNKVFGKNKKASAVMLGIDHVQDIFQNLNV